MQMNLNNKHNKTGFTTPENYFKNLEANLYEQLHIPTKTGHTIPQHYFDRAEKNILNKTIYKQPKTIALSKRNTWLLTASIAASILLSIVLLQPQKNTIVNFDTIEYATLENYIETESFNLSAIEITELYSINTQDLDSVNFGNLNEKTVLEYLSSETINDDFTDYEFISNQL